MEQRGFGACQPDLPAALVQSLEQGGAARRIEMRGDFIEEEDRALLALFGDEIGMGQDDAEEQCLLFAG